VAEIAFIGQERLVRVFTYFGIDVFPVASVSEAQETLQKLTADRGETWRLVYIEEALTEEIQEQIRVLNRQPLPVISIVSLRGTPQGIGKSTLHNLVRKATGVELRIEEH
jgi:vacuolar-type H+-ATPase subunit F/Vma7